MFGKRAWVPAAVIGLLVIGVLLIRATIPASNGVIYACYDNNNGMLRVIDNATTTCKNNETQLTWNQTGPIGPQGAHGRTRSSGPARTARTEHFGIALLKWYPANQIAQFAVGTKPVGVAFDGANIWWQTVAGTPSASYSAEAPEQAGARRHRPPLVLACSPLSAGQ